MLDRYTVEAAAEQIRAAIESTERAKPGDRSEDDRRVAVTITMLEQAYAYFHAYVMVGDTQ